MKRKMLLILMVMLAIAGELSSLHASEKPEIFVQTGHASPVEFLVVDKNERYLVSVEDSMGGKYLKIWEISSGKEESIPFLVEIP